MPVLFLLRANRDIRKKKKLMFTGGKNAIKQTALRQTQICVPNSVCCERNHYVTVLIKTKRQPVIVFPQNAQNISADPKAK